MAAVARTAAARITRPLPARLTRRRWSTRQAKRPRRRARLRRCATRRLLNPALTWRSPTSGAALSGCGATCAPTPSRRAAPLHLLHRSRPLHSCRRRPHPYILGVEVCTLNGTFTLLLPRPHRASEINRCSRLTRRLSLAYCHACYTGVPLHLSLYSTFRSGRYACRYTFRSGRWRCLSSTAPTCCSSSSWRSTISSRTCTCRPKVRECGGENRLAHILHTLRECCVCTTPCLFAVSRRAHLYPLLAQHLCARPFPPYFPSSSPVSLRLSHILPHPPRER